MIQLLPHRYKRIGLIIAPTGFFLWIAMHMEWISEISQLLGLENLRVLNISCAILGFFSFLFGTYALAFSKEKAEDEMIKRIRLESLQLAALLQMIFLIVGLILVAFMKNAPGDGGLMLFFILAIFIFWIFYIIRFNYIIHIKVYRYEK